MLSRCCASVPVLPLNAVATSRQATAEASLLSWCRSRGACSKALDVSVLSSVRGLRATRSVAPGTHLFSVPLELCISSESGPAEWTPEARLAARLLEEDAAPGSPFRPWLDVLPRDVSHFGAFFDFDERTRSYAPLKRLRSRLAALNAVAEPTVLEHLRRSGVRASPALFAWAVALVRTRAFEATPGTDVFVPFLDLANHSPRDACLAWDWDPASQSMVVSSCGAGLVAGTEAFNSYGERDNDSCFLYGGFVVQNNEDDTVEVFDTLAAASEWWVTSRVGAMLAGNDGPGAVGAEEARTVARALEAAAAQHAARSGEAACAGLALGHGFDVDGRLVDLFEALASREVGPRLAPEAATAAVCMRAKELLDSWPAQQPQRCEIAEEDVVARRNDLCDQLMAAKRSLLATFL